MVGVSLSPRRSMSAGSARCHLSEPAAGAVGRTSGAANCGSSAFGAVSVDFMRARLHAPSRGNCGVPRRAATRCASSELSLRTHRRLHAALGQAGIALHAADFDGAGDRRDGGTLELQQIEQLLLAGGHRERIKLTVDRSAVGGAGIRIKPSISRLGTSVPSLVLVPPAITLIAGSIRASASTSPAGRWCRRAGSGIAALSAECCGHS